MVTVLAPAKINLGLEIIGRRADGYHDIRSILIPVSLFDRVTVGPARVSSIWTNDSSLDAHDNLALRAAAALAIPLRIEIHKRIPLAAGLGGASSDAAAVLNAAWMLELEPGLDRLHAIGRSLGADVPFFLESGAVLASGRGDEFSAIAQARLGWFVVAIPCIEIPSKTATLYAALTPGDFSDGSVIELLAAAISSGRTSTSAAIGNAFERPLYDGWPAARQVRDAMIAAGAAAVGLSGAGPAHYAICDDFRAAAALAAATRKRVNRETRVVVCRPLTEPMPHRFVH